jgi:hypothetical protein
VRNEEKLLRVKEERNILRTRKRRKVSWLGHTLRRNCLLKHIIEGMSGKGIEMMGKQGRIRKKLLDYFRKRNGTEN